MSKLFLSVIVPPGANLYNLFTDQKIKNEARMFFGHYETRLNEQGALVLPPAFSRPGEAVLVPGFDPCLLFLPVSVWRGWVEAMNALNTASQPVRLLRRMLVGLASMVSVSADKSILLPDDLKRAVHLDEVVVLVGQGAYFEIWPKRTWQTQQNILQEFRWDAQIDLSLPLADVSVERS